MNLYILRHASAGLRRPNPLLDSKRPLDKEGKKHCLQLAHVLNALNIQFDLIVSSPPLSPAPRPATKPRSSTPPRSPPKPPSRTSRSSSASAPSARTSSSSATTPTLLPSWVRSSCPPPAPRQRSV